MIRGKVTSICQAASLGAAVLCASTAHAQSSVNLYGLVDMGLRMDHTSSGTTKALQSGMGSGNRWGIRGSEDLGGGLKAIFWLEAGFTADTGVMTANGGTATGFSRTSLVGLQSDQWGTLNLGRQYTPVFNFLSGGVDPLGIGTIGNFNNSVGLQAGLPARVDNAIGYISPKWAGFKTELQWSLGETSAANRPSRAGDQRGALFSYENGAWLVGYTYQDTRGAKDVSDHPVQKRQLLGTTYDLKFAKLHGVYQLNRNDGTGTARIDRQTVALGVQIPMFQVGRLVAEVQSSNDKTVANADARVMTLAYNHYLSKRTDVYVAVARIDNRNGAAFGILDATNTSLGTIAGGSNPSSVAVGIRHRF